MRKKPSTLAEVYAEREFWSRRIDRARARRDAAERTIEQAQRHIGVTVMVQQVADLMAPHFPHHTLRVLGPFGLANETAIHVNDDGGNTVGSLTFRPHHPHEDSRMVLRLVDRSRSLSNYPPGSIGALNGLNYPEVELPATIHELAQVVRKYL